jgi:hypothetical protein
VTEKAARGGKQPKPAAWLAVVSDGSLAASGHCDGSTEGHREAQPVGWNRANRSAPVAALNPPAHFHCCVLDGVFEAESASLLTPAQGGCCRCPHMLGVPLLHPPVIPYQPPVSALALHQRPGSEQPCAYPLSLSAIGSILHGNDARLDFGIFVVTVSL